MGAVALTALVQLSIPKQRDNPLIEGPPRSLVIFDYEMSASYADGGDTLDLSDFFTDVLAIHPSGNMGGVAIQPVIGDSPATCKLKAYPAGVSHSHDVAATVTNGATTGTVTSGAGTTALTSGAATVTSGVVDGGSFGALALNSTAATVTDTTGTSMLTSTATTGTLTSTAVIGNTNPVGAETTATDVTTATDLSAITGTLLVIGTPVLV